jgi:hypothetical protein
MRKIVRRHLFRIIIEIRQPQNHLVSKEDQDLLRCLQTFPKLLLSQAAPRNEFNMRTSLKHGNDDDEEEYDDDSVARVDENKDLLFESLIVRP